MLMMILIPGAVPDLISDKRTAILQRWRCDAGQEAMYRRGFVIIP
jgi:hypothetical protein